MAQDQEFTLSDVSEHSTSYDAFVVIHSSVYDITNYLTSHPGGEDILLELAGQDASEAFEDAHHSKTARETLGTLQVGVLKNAPDEVSKIAKTSTILGVTKLSNVNLVLVVNFIILVVAAMYGVLVIDHSMIWRSLQT